jgi:hypothetical protein
MVNHLLIEGNTFSGIGAATSTSYTAYIRMNKFTSLYSTTSDVTMHGNTFENRAGQVVTDLYSAIIATGAHANPGDTYYGGVIPVLNAIGNICKIGTTAVEVNLGLDAGLVADNINFV